MYSKMYQEKSHSNWFLTPDIIWQICWILFSSNRSESNVTCYTRLKRFSCTLTSVSDMACLTDQDQTRTVFCRSFRREHDHLS